MRTILVIEDEETNRTIITRFLGSRGYSMVAAANGREGLYVALQHMPDLILMDMSMPVLDGWSTTAQIKAHPHLMHIPVIAVTAHSLTGDRQRALAAGCDDYLSKPVDLWALLRMVQHHIEDQITAEPPQPQV